MLLRAAWDDARRRITELGRLIRLVDRASATMLHVETGRLTPMAVPFMVIVGRESLPPGAEADKTLLAQAEALAAEAMALWLSRVNPHEPWLNGALSVRSSAVRLIGPAQTWRRDWHGVAVLDRSWNSCAAVTAGVGGTAIAQDRLQAFEKLREHAGQRRSKPADPNPTPISAPGDYRFSFVHDGLTRDYLVHVPRTYRPGHAAPMLMALHGGGGDSDFQADDSKYRLISKSEQAGFIAVFPNGFSRLPSGILATWNAGACCGAAVKNKVDDVGFLREVILRVEQQASVDQRRVFVTGMSNGGLMSYRMACEASDLVRAIAPVAGTDNTTACRPSRRCP